MQDNQFGNHPQIDATLSKYVVFFALAILVLVKIAPLESCSFLGLQSGFQVVSKEFSELIQISNWKSNLHGGDSNTCICSEANPLQLEAAGAHNFFGVLPWHHPAKGRVCVCV